MRERIKITNQNQKSKNNGSKKYNPREIEPKWQKIWKEKNLYKFKHNPQKQKYYNLVELPYPSGDLHLGHWFSFVTGDVHARMKQMHGLNVFFSNGFDAFGLPAENAAIKRGVHPQDWTMSNIKTMRKQFDTMGTMIDWSHEAITCLPEYYRWNQWIFLKMFEKGLAYRGKALSNWCPKDQTVLANEHIEGGRCWRCGTQVIQKEIAQWFLKITAYADKLIWPKNPSVDWPESVREGQNNWIGRSEGVQIGFKIQDSNPIKSDSKFKIEVFTTALDTVYGLTFMVISPENPLVKKITTSDQKKEIEQYIKNSQKKSELERTALEKDKTGVFTGSYCINPFNGEKVPIWVADYVIMTYGTGAVMGVPGHDARDYEFAKKFNLSIKPVIRPSEDAKGANVEKDGFWNYGEIKTAFKDKSVLFNSREFNGLNSFEAKKKMEEFIEKKGLGKRKYQYHLRDWSISRQRYWGTPVPMIHCKKCGIVPVPYDQLPVELPYNVDYTPKGEPPLASNKKWLEVSCPTCGGKAQRDAETLDTFFDSAWYYYRYTDPKYDKGPFDEDLVQELLPVDIYYGGAEHTLGHTLYARFFTKFFKDIRLVGFDEFAKRRVQHGVILGPDGNRMSKSRGNVVNPDDLIKEYGTDTVRTYLCFMMPYEATAPWSTEGIWGSHRFLKRVWELQRMIHNKCQMINEDLVWMNKTIKKVGDDIQLLKFNTAVAALMTWLNYLEEKKEICQEEYQNLLLLLAPFAPHMTEELYQNQKSKIKNQKFYSVHQQSWPEFDKKYLQEGEVTIVVQVNGKIRDNIRIANYAFVPSSGRGELRIKETVEQKARESGKVNKHLAGKHIKKVIYVEGRVLNFVTE